MNTFNMRPLRAPAFLLTIVMCAGCGELAELNENPNQPEAVTPDVLLPGTIRDVSDVLVGHAFYISNCASQLSAKSLRNEVDVYNWNAVPIIGFDALWPALYGALRDIRNIEAAAIERNDDRLLAVAKTMRAFAFSVLTDTYGDIPYSQALAGNEGTYFPAYDTQEDIYLGEGGLLDELDEAHALFTSAGPGTVQGDILFNGNSDLWHRFANALHLRLLVHCSAQTDVAAEFAQVAARPLMESTAHNAALDYLSSFPNQFPIVPLKQGDFESVRFGQAAFARMEATNDPRMMRFARATDATIGTGNEAFEGWENGGKGCDDSGSRLGLAYYDYPGHPTATTKAPGMWLSYAEQEFILAEGAWRGWTAGEAGDHYAQGIAASMTDHGADPADTGLDGLDGFLAQDNVAWNDTPTRLFEQKWLALYFHGMEPYFEVRRWYTSGGGWEGVPFLSAPCNNTNGDNLPLRFIYPSDEQSLNGASFSAAVERLGGSNSFNAAMWLVAP